MKNCRKMSPKALCFVQLILFSFGQIESKAVEERLIDLSHLNIAAFAFPSEKTGVFVSDWDENSESNPEELGEYAEGDILFPNLAGRNGLKAESTRWPNAIIPYEINGDFNAHDMALIEQAINVYHNKTCLKFKPRMGEADYVRITTNSTGCWSSVGRIGGRQDVNLQTPGCLKRIGTVLHELMHAAGFLHEQNRHERDNYVEIVWKNIKQGHGHNFDKAKKSKTNDFGIVYDYNSIMHYSSKAFSINGERTIIPKTMNMEIGQRKGFSRGDIQKINRMYNCSV